MIPATEAPELSEPDDTLGVHCPHCGWRGLVLHLAPNCRCPACTAPATVED